MSYIVQAALMLLVIIAVSWGMACLIVPQG
jgi:hypothetical protein